MLEERKVKIVLALSEAGNGAPAGYICQKCMTDETCDAMQAMPCKPLVQLEQDGLIERLAPSSWSYSFEPRYSLSARTREVVNNLLATRHGQVNLTSYS